MSWYRTYRPQTITSLHIKPAREEFWRILQTGAYSHAYLLSGPKGTGKTSGARILAKVLNCERNRTVIEHRLQATGNRLQKKTEEKTTASSLSSVASLKEPCNTCDSCVAITSGSSLSVTEIDAASNRGIDDIRALRERIGMAPPDGAVSVFIIDEVHMLTTEAFNALLKVLEEPPAHVVFILATTDAQKMPATVVSRCTLIQYRKATVEELQDSLRAIAESEKITVDADVLRTIATAGDGSFRDAVKVFEQLALGRSALTVEDLADSKITGSTRQAANLLTALLQSDEKTVVEIFEDLRQRGGDGTAFEREVLTLGHAKLVEFAASDDKRLRLLTDLLTSIAVPIDQNIPVAWLPFEIACVEYVLTKKGLITASEPPTRSTPQDLSSPPVSKKSAPGQQSSIPPSSPAPAKKSQSTPKTLPAALHPVDFATLTAQWPTILSLVRKKSTPVEGLLKATRLIGSELGLVIIEASYQFHKEQLELARNALVIEEILESVLQQPLRLRVELGKAALRVIQSGDNNVSGKVADENLVQAAQDAFL